MKTSQNKSLRKSWLRTSASSQHFEDEELEEQPEWVVLCVAYINVSLCFYKVVENIFQESNSFTSAQLFPVKCKGSQMYPSAFSQHTVCLVQSQLRDSVYKYFIQYWKSCFINVLNQKMAHKFINQENSK